MFKYLRNFAASGTLMSTSAPVISKLTREVIHSNKPQTIVELGGGTGKVTRHILQHMNTNATLYCFEIQSHFIDELQKIEDNRFKLINDSAVNILDHIDKGSVDIIVSTLPLSFFKPTIRKKLLAGCYQALKGEGIFRQLSYVFFPKYFRSFFNKVRTELWFTMPPSVFYFCSKAGERQQ